MSTPPTGRLVPNATGHDLVLERTFRASISNVWASIVEPDRMNRWIGTWTGEAGPGKRVTFTMTAEDSAEPEDVLIKACEAPTLLDVELHVKGMEGSPVWRIRIELSEQDGVTTLVFRQEVDRYEDLSSVGPGWEYYLDRLTALHAGQPFAAWSDYYPSQRSHWEREARAAAANQ